MPKGYISFDDFKASQKVKSHIQKCPKCHKPTDTIIYNSFGKGMCADCFAATQERSTVRNKQDDKDLGLELDIEYDKY